MNPIEFIGILQTANLQSENLVNPQAYVHSKPSEEKLLQMH